MSTVYLGLGSNIGDRQVNLRGALKSLSQQITTEQVSSIYETEPVGYKEQPWFLNLVCVGETKMDPFELLAFAKEIEVELGRVSTFPNAPRPIDIDLLLYDDEKIDTDDLIIPHPRMAQRRFVLVPMVEIAETVVHSGNSKTMKDLLSDLSDSIQVRKWGDV